MKEMNLTEGSIFHKIIQFSLPMILGNLLQQVYNLADTLIVGRYIGADALAAVGSAYTLMIFVTSILIGLCMGSGALFSVDFGAGEKEQLQEFGNAYSLFVSQNHGAKKTERIQKGTQQDGFYISIQIGEENFDQYHVMLYRA